MNEDGRHGPAKRLANSPQALVDAVGCAGPGAEVVLEATCGWYRAYDCLVETGASVHLANPNGLNWGHRRVKNDERDAIDLADMLRMGRLPEAWPAPPAARELRELVRYRAKLVQLRAGMRSKAKAVLTKCGVVATRAKLASASRQGIEVFGLEGAYQARMRSLSSLVAALGPRWRPLTKRSPRGWLATSVTGPSWP